MARPISRGITKAEATALHPARTDPHRDRNPGHPLWPHAGRASGGALVDHARGICGHFAKGHAGNRYELLAAP